MRKSTTFVDIFFHQDHGAWILLGIVPYLYLCRLALLAFLGLPSLSYPAIASPFLRCAFNTVVFSFVYCCVFTGSGMAGPSGMR